MSVGRIVGTAAAIVTVGGCAVAVVGHGARRRRQAPHARRARPGRHAASSSIPAQLPGSTRSPLAARRRVIGTRPRSRSQSVTSVAPSTTAVTSVRPTPTHTHARGADDADEHADPDADLPAAPDPDAA